MISKGPQLLPRRLVHRGSVVALGLAFDAQKDEASLRALVLEQWRPRSRLLVFPDHWVLIWPRERRILAEGLRGAPLVAYGNALSIAPLTEREAAALPVAPPSCCFVREGALTMLPESSARAVDPSEWFPTFQVIEAKPLAAPTPPIKMAVPVRASTPREALGNVVGESPAERMGIEAALERSKRRNAGNAAGETSSSRALAAPRSSGPKPWHRLLAWMLGMSKPSPSGAGAGASALARRQPGLWHKLRERIAHWLWQSQVGKWLGHQHAAYLERMMEMFERGDYHEALRHAIPTSKLAGTGLEKMALLPAGPRASLTLGGARPASSMGFGGGLYEHLRAMYRRAFEELERRGEILQAAFVLSELLQDDHAAVDFLERHGQLLQAAELAEARQLGSALIVRQWFLAGEKQRALLIARRDGVFEDAIARLKNAPEEQRALRLLWADHLAESGRYGEAVLLLDQAGEGDALRKAWLDLAIEGGGVAGARALVLKCARYPEEFDVVRERAVSLFDDEGPELAAARLAFAQALALRKSEQASALLRGASRAVIRDRARGLNRERRAVLRELALKGDDGALHADVPEIPSDEGIRHQEPCKRHVFSEHDRGPSRLFDAVYLEDGRVLVAKGEAGCFLHSRGMKLAHHFDIPAIRLIPSVHGSRVLALATRDDQTIVSQIDVAARRCQRWIEAKLTSYSHTFDGSVWYVAWGGAVHALDVTHAGLSSIWQSGVAEEAILVVTNDAKNMSFLTESECWTHALGPHRLSARPRVEGFPLISLISPKGVVGELSQQTTEAGDMLVFTRPGGGSPLPIGGLDVVSAGLRFVSGEWVVLLVDVFAEVPKALDVHVIEHRTNRRAALVRLQGTSVAHARVDGDVLTVCDEHGRVLALDLVSQAVLVDARL